LSIDTAPSTAINAITTPKAANNFVLTGTRIEK